MPDHAELLPTSPIPWVKELLLRPSDAWPADWYLFPNVAQAFRELMIEARDRVPAAPQWVEDRGIVICSGGWHYFPSLFVTVACIRKVGCELPIQIWYLGDRGEFDERMRQALEPFGVRWICGNSFMREQGLPHRVLGGWELKPCAAAFSPFREVISLDADSYPAYNPERLMEHAEFRRVGAAFWPDGWKLQPEQWAQFGVPFHDEPSWETGQFIIDKSRHWQPLWLTVWLNDFSPYVYQHLYGDKDTFHFAWRFCQREVCMPTQGPNWSSCAFLQLDFAGEPLFCHRIADKFRWSGGQIDGQDVVNSYRSSQWCGETQRVPELPHEDFAHEMLRYSDELVRPERCFHFVDGPGGSSRDAWNADYLHNQLALPRELPADGVVLDLGARVGQFTRACLRRGARRVVAVESRTANLEALRHNLSDYEGRATIVMKPSGWPAPPAGPPTDEAVDSFDELLTEAAELGDGRVSLMKVDTGDVGDAVWLTAAGLGVVESVVVRSPADSLGRLETLLRMLRERGFHVEASPATAAAAHVVWARR